MSVKARKRKRASFKPGSAADGYRRLSALQRDLEQMAADGVYDDDPEMKARILAKYNPLLELAVIGTRAASDSQRILCNKIVADFTLVPLTHKADEDGGGASIIQIAIAPWCALPESNSTPKPIEMRPAVDMIASDREGRAHSSMPASADVLNPAPIDERQAPGAELYDVQTGSDGLAHAVKHVEAELVADDPERWETLIDNGTGAPIRVRVHG